MSSLAPRLGAAALVLASLGAGLATVAATSPPPPAPQTGAPLAASGGSPVMTVVTPPPTTTPAPAPATTSERTPSAPPTSRTTTAVPTPSPAPATPPPSSPAPPPRPKPSPPVIVAQTAQPASINREGCGGARSKITVKLAPSAPATAVTLHVTGPGGATRNRAMSGSGTSWTETLGPYSATGTATWSVTARNGAGVTHGALKTVKVVAC
jgi:outer membrane biosynthesis protein TonB